MTAAPESGAGKAEPSHLDFFISYTRADERWVEWIAWQLEIAGSTTKIMAWDFRPGTSFPREMQEAAKEAERTLAVLSPAYLQSAFCAPEWEAAFLHFRTSTLDSVAASVSSCANLFNSNIACARSK